jgi:hypothetical protein
MKLKKNFLNISNSCSSEYFDLIQLVLVDKFEKNTNLRIGDSVICTYRSGVNYYSMEGLFVGKRFSQLQNLNSTLIIRASIDNVGIQSLFFY